jgi:hypothetical protein
MTMMRQGDVLLRKAEVPKEAKKGAEGNVVLAYGEATGHHHTLAGKVKEMVLGERKFVVVEDVSQLTHQEHGTITVEPGTYEVVRQREWSDEEERRVRD